MIALIISILVFLGTGAHIGLALAFSGIVYAIFFSGWSLASVSQAYLDFISSYSLMAIPLFVMAGYMMEEAGVTEKLFRFAEGLTRPIPGGLGVGTIVACALMAAITGSTFAEAAAMGTIAGPVLVKRGYDRAYTAALIASAGTLGIMIPPSLNMIIYGSFTNTSIPALFFAGFLPGILLTILLSFVAYRTAKRAGMRGEPGASPRELISLVWEGMGGILSPIIVLGGLYGGVFTPTEAGGAAIAYAIVYGLVTKGKGFVMAIPTGLLRSIRMCALVFFIAGGAGILSHIVTLEQVPARVMDIISGLALGPIEYLFVVSFIYLILGMFLDALSVVMLTIPVIFPVGMALGIDPVHLGVIVVVNTEIAVITPPVGLNIYCTAGILNAELHDVFKKSFPFFLALVLFLLIVIFFPAICTVVPRYLNLY